MKHVWDIDYCPKKLPEQMNVFELRDYVKRLEEKLENKDKTIKAIIDGNRRPHGEWIYDVFDENYHCSECGKECGSPYDFCPNCGADMRTQNDRSWDTSERGVSGSVSDSITQKEGESN